MGVRRLSERMARMIVLLTDRRASREHGCGKYGRGESDDDGHEDPPLRSTVHGDPLTPRPNDSPLFYRTPRPTRCWRAASVGGLEMTACKADRARMRANQAGIPP